MTFSTFCFSSCMAQSTDYCQTQIQLVIFEIFGETQAEAIGKAGQDYLDTLNMDRVYDYMYHLIKEYSKLQDFKPIPPSSAQELCIESLLCFADPKQKQFLEQSATSLSSMPPCVLPKPDYGILKTWKKQKETMVQDIIKRT